MKINKTDQDAQAFAETLTDRGEREVFQHSWDNKRWDICIPHFPAFGLVVEDDADIRATDITQKQIDAAVIPSAQDTQNAITDLHAIMGDVTATPKASATPKAPKKK